MKELKRLKRLKGGRGMLKLMVNDARCKAHGIKEFPPMTDTPEHSEWSSFANWIFRETKTPDAQTCRGLLLIINLTSILSLANFD